MDVQLRITSDVHGAAYPVNGWGTACSGQAFNETPCDCYGGAARRQTFLGDSRDEPHVVSIDLGDYFSGSGLFFSSFHSLSCQP